MKTLNELTPKERLELYKKALVDWTERPNSEKAYIDYELCHYFRATHRIETFLCYAREWGIHVRQQIKKNGRSIFLADASDPIPRIAALNAMIKELEEVV